MLYCLIFNINNFSHSVSPMGALRYQHYDTHASTALRRMKFLHTFGYIKKGESKRCAYHRGLMLFLARTKNIPSQGHCQAACPHTDGSKPQPRAQAGPAPREERDLNCQRPKLEQISTGKWPLRSQGGDSNTEHQPSRRGQEGGGSRTPSSKLDQPHQHLPVVRSLIKAQRTWAHPAMGRINTQERISLEKCETWELLRHKSQG